MILAKIPNLSFSHLHLTAAVVGGGVAVLMVVVAAVVWAAAEVGNTYPTDRLVIRRVWDRRGIRDYLGRSTNPAVPEGMSVVIGRPVDGGCGGAASAGRSGRAGSSAPSSTPAPESGSPPRM